MITFFKNHVNSIYSQDDYDKDVNTLDLSTVKCSCNHIGSFSTFGKYQRYLQLYEKTTIITIKRVRCNSCMCTHALLPYTIIPYRILSNPFICKIIESFKNSNLTVSTIAKLYKLSYQCVRKLIEFYLKEHKQRLLSLLSTYSLASLFSESFITLYYNENKILFMQRTSANPPHLLLTS